MIFLVLNERNNARRLGLTLNHTALQAVSNVVKEPQTFVHATTIQEMPSYYSSTV